MGQAAQRIHGKADADGVLVATDNLLQGSCGRLQRRAGNRGAVGTEDDHGPQRILAHRRAHRLESLKAKIDATALAYIALIGGPHELDAPSLRPVHGQPVFLAAQTLHQCFEASGNQYLADPGGDGATAETA